MAVVCSIERIARWELIVSSAVSLSFVYWSSLFSRYIFFFFFLPPFVVAVLVLFSVSNAHARVTSCIYILGMCLLQTKLNNEMEWKEEKRGNAALLVDVSYVFFSSLFEFSIKNSRLSSVLWAHVTLTQWGVWVHVRYSATWRIIHSFVRCDERGSLFICCPSLFKRIMIIFFRLP